MAQVKEEFLEEAVKNIPVDRLGQLAKLLRLYPTLAPEADYIAGTVFRVDGGLAM